MPFEARAARSSPFAPRGIWRALACVCLAQGVALFHICDSLCVYTVDLALSVSINEDKCSAVLEFQCICVARSLKNEKEKRGGKAVPHRPLAAGFLFKSNSR